MNPDHLRQYRRVVFYGEYLVSCLYPQYAIIGLDILRSSREVIKSSIWYIDEHAANKFCPFACSLYRILDAAFPFKHCPTCKAILRQLRKDLLEVNLAIATTAEPPRAIFPVLVAPIDTRAG